MMISNSDMNDEGSDADDNIDYMYVYNSLGNEFNIMF